MSSSSSSSAAGRKTRSDTLKLQRLIEVLKERGSDLGSTLESSASDFLTDVKPHAVGTTAAAAAAAAGPGIAAVPAQYRLEHQTGDEDEGSNFGGECEGGDDWEWEEEDDNGVKGAMAEVSAPPDPPAMSDVQERSAPKRPPRLPPSLPPPPLPADDEEPAALQSARRRSSLQLAKDTASKMVEAANEILGLKMHVDADPAGGGRRRKKAKAKKKATAPNPSVDKHSLLVEMVKATLLNTVVAVPAMVVKEVEVTDVYIAPATPAPAPTPVPEGRALTKSVPAPSHPMPAPLPAPALAPRAVPARVDTPCEPVATAAVLLKEPERGSPVTVVVHESDSTEADVAASTSCSSSSSSSSTTSSSSPSIETGLGDGNSSDDYDENKENNAGAKRRLLKPPRTRKKTKPTLASQWRMQRGRQRSRSRESSPIVGLGSGSAAVVGDRRDKDQGPGVVGAGS